MQEGMINPPVKIGDVLKLGVLRIGKSGDPILIYKKYIIFLKDFEKRGVPLKEMINIKITKVFPKYAFAERTNGN